MGRGSPGRGEAEFIRSCLCRVKIEKLRSIYEGKSATFKDPTSSLENETPRRFAMELQVSRTLNVAGILDSKIPRRGANSRGKEHDDKKSLFIYATFVFKKWDAE